MSIDPEIMSGAAVFAGTRVPIQTIFDYIEGGNDLETFLDDFPSVTKEAAVNVAFASSKPAEEIIKDIRSSRKFRKKEIKF